LVIEAGLSGSSMFSPASTWPLVWSIRIQAFAPSGTGAAGVGGGATSGFSGTGIGAGAWAKAPPASIAASRKDRKRETDIRQKLQLFRIRAGRGPMARR